MLKLKHGNLILLVDFEYKRLRWEDLTNAWEYFEFLDNNDMILTNEDGYSVTFNEKEQKDPFDKLRFLYKKYLIKKAIKEKLLNE